MQIRHAALGDIDSIIDMQRQIYVEHLAWDAARWTIAMPLDQAYRAWLTHLVTDSSEGLALVAESNDRVVGYLIAEVEGESTRHWSPRAVYLHDVYVDSSSRRSGAASRLMEAVLQWTATHHPSLQVRLITAMPNEGARAFFSRFGFRPCVVEMIRE